MVTNPFIEASFFNHTDQIQFRVAGSAAGILDIDLKKTIVDTPGREFLQPIFEKFGFDFI